MSCEAFPFLFLNMSGEMIYIVEQRLTAQRIDRTKANKGKEFTFIAILILIYSSLK
jgi:hypothetical protein